MPAPRREVKAPRGAAAPRLLEAQQKRRFELPQMNQL